MTRAKLLVFQRDRATSNRSVEENLVQSSMECILSDLEAAATQREFRD